MKTINIFLASSNSLAKERTAIECLISRINDDLIERGFYLRLHFWDKFSKTHQGKRKQDFINKYIKKSNIFIVLFSNYVGEFTYEEYRKALNTYEENKKLQILIYMSKLNNQEKIDEIKEIEKEIISINQVWDEYTSLDNLESLIKNELFYFLKINKNVLIYEKTKTINFKLKGIGKDLTIQSNNIENFHDKLYSYIFKNCKIKIKGEDVNFETQVITKYLYEEKEDKGIIKGVGRISQEGYALINYEGIYPKLQEKWQGNIILYIPNMGKITGYWMSYHTIKEKSGPYAMGDIELYRY